MMSKWDGKKIREVRCCGYPMEKYWCEIGGLQYECKKCHRSIEIYFEEDDE